MADEKLPTSTIGVPTTKELADGKAGYDRFFIGPRVNLRGKVRLTWDQLSALFKAAWAAATRTKETVIKPVIGDSNAKG